MEPSNRSKALTSAQAWGYSQGLQNGVVGVGAGHAETHLSVPVQARQKHISQSSRNTGKTQSAMFFFQKQGTLEAVCTYRSISLQIHLPAALETPCVLTEPPGPLPLRSWHTLRGLCRALRAPATSATAEQVTWEAVMSLGTRTVGTWIWQGHKAFGNQLTIWKTLETDYHWCITDFFWEYFMPKCSYSFFPKWMQFMDDRLLEVCESGQLSRWHRS